MRFRFRFPAVLKLAAAAVLIGCLGGAVATQAQSPATGQLRAVIYQTPPTTANTVGIGLAGNNGVTSPAALAGQAFGTTTSAPAHLVSAQSAAPTLSSCGTSPSIAGTDTAGIVTMGTSATGCVITFAQPYNAAPYCVVSWIATPLASQSYVTSATAISTTQTSANGNKLQYVCIAQSGG
jgi:hypothetical protein